MHCNICVTTTINSSGNTRSNASANTGAGSGGGAGGVILPEEMVAMVVRATYTSFTK
jgi:hypothetical protein